MSQHSSNSIRQRRGITLLFVVTMLVLFLLMGTAFVIVSNDFFKSARKRSIRSNHSTDGVALLEWAFYDLLRGPALTNSTSPLRGHSLLADMYGYGIDGSVATAAADSSGHFIVLTLNADTTRLIDHAPTTLDPIPGNLSGLVLNVVSGPAKGLVTRVVDHQISGSASGGYTHTLYVFPIRARNEFDVTNASSIASSRIVINGRPFAGSGAGHYNPYTPLTAAALSNSALNPNQSGRTIDELLGKTGSGYFSRLRQTTTGFTTDPNSQGPNESYDALDFQNMFLAGINPDGSLANASFYQPLIASNPRGDFRAFQRGGLNDDGISVDNNQDGLEDGIWTDIGLPVETRADGTRVKPLVSYTVLDMDGRLNLNAHGSLYRDGNRMMSEISLLGAPASPALKRGQGYGPPEISLTPALSSSANSVMQNRYGSDGKPGEPDVRDDWSRYRMFGYPDASFGAMIPGTVDHQFGTAMDIHGRFATVYPQIFDIADNTFPIGMPVANVGFSNLPNEIVDSPYEMTFFEPNERGFDSPFQADELEGLFRRFDIDSQMLPQRINNLGLSSSAARSVTTHSFEVPTTFESLPERLFNILDTVTGTEGVPTSTPNREATIRDQMITMLPPEIFRGLPMNVNRDFGDGIDNNGNGVTDEMNEVDSLTHPNGAQFNFDHDNDSIVDPMVELDSALARAKFARHLYIVTLLVTERVDRNGDGMISTADWYDFDDDGTTDLNDRIKYRKVVAQWAANVVDFRDRDSIMTPVEVDLNPWNGWDVDGNVSTTETLLEGSPQQEMRFVAWGAERPELLITETLVTHDRRTQDLSIESVPPGSTANSVNASTDPDSDFDSHLVPRVSAFFELYNPWVMNDANQVRPGELYDPGLNGVDLQRTSTNGSSPVWRLLVTETGDQDLDPDDPSQNDLSEEAVSVRRIYFARPSSSVDSGPEVYFPADDIHAKKVGPGRYAVVGTQGVKVGDRYDTYFGRRLTPDALTPNELENMTRRISLDPTNGRLENLHWDPATNDFEVFVRSVIALPIGLNDGGWERELGVSDPVEGYYNLTGEGGIAIDLEPVPDGLKFTESVTTGSPQDYAFDQPIDQIIDPDHYDRYLKNDGLQPAADRDSGTAYDTYRTVHLQRLANPLMPYNARSNPYRTIDSHAIDLFVFNGAETVDDPNNMPGIMRFGTFERRGDINSDQGQEIGRHRLLFKNDRDGWKHASDIPAADLDDNYFNGLDQHIFSRNLFESLGGLNQAFRDADAGNPVPFCWLTWNNRPYASQLELANVPHTSSYWMTRSFDISSDATRDVYQPPIATDPVTGGRNYSAHFPHLLNFYADEVMSTSGGPTNGPSLHRLFDYLEVPSRFVGTESYVNPATFADDLHNLSYGLAVPFDTVSKYRYPGKININTVLNPQVWQGLMGDYGTDVNGTVSYADWIASRAGTSSVSDFANPYRAAGANNLVPPGVPVVEPAETGLFRTDAGGLPLFDYDPAPNVSFADDDRAAYFKYDQRQRLGNLVTSRSSVFAIWITVGYFEVNDQDGLRTQTMAPYQGQGFEAGADTGEIQRHRAFFLVDRSIPVAFEPGKNHNVDRAVLVKTIIE